MTFALNLKLVGVAMFVLAGCHPFFSRYFKWDEELPRLSLINRNIFVVHCFFIVLMLIFFGVLSIFYTDLLLRPDPLARAVLLGMALFWTVRLFCQWFVYDARLWRGHTLHTVMHVIFSGLWLWFAGSYGAAFWLQYEGR